jgi:hypothetical protein
MVRRAWDAAGGERAALTAVAARDLACPPKAITADPAMGVKGRVWIAEGCGKRGVYTEERAWEVPQQSDDLVVSIVTHTFVLLSQVALPAGLPAAPTAGPPRLSDP